MPPIQGKKRKQGHWEEYGKELKKNLVNFETLYKCNYPSLEKLCNGTDVGCTLVWKQSKVLNIKELGACITSQVAM